MVTLSRTSAYACPEDCLHADLMHAAEDSLRSYLVAMADGGVMIHAYRLEPCACGEPQWALTIDERWQWGLPHTQAHPVLQ